MKIGRYIYGKLSGTTAITNLVGTRIYPVFLPMAAAYPAIVYMQTCTPKDNGMKVEKPDHDDHTVTLHIWADHAQGAEAYDVLDDIEAELRTALDRVEATVNAVQVESCIYTGSRDGRDEDRTLVMREVTFKFTTAN